MADAPNEVGRAWLNETIRHEIEFVFLDIAGQPMRVTTGPYSVSFPAGFSDDEDLNGKTFEAVDGRFVGIGPIHQKEDGADTVTASLSGLAGIDDETMTIIGNKANWQGRDARIWKALLNPDDPTELVSIWAHHSGYMAVPKITGNAETQTIALDIESWLAFLTQPSNRTYLNQRLFDPGDTSADQAIAIANGAGQPK
ncbi:MAG: hypothetical protein PGN09_07700 [Sphingomonas fennica]